MLVEQSHVATPNVQWGWRGLGRGRGDALLRFARSCKQTVSRNPFRHPIKRERWIQKGALLLQLCLALCFALSLRAAKQSVIQAPSPLTRKADLRKKLMHNTKFNKTKFSALKIQVSVSKIWIQDYSNSLSSQIYVRRFARVFYCLFQEAGRIYNRESKKR